jgi:hypothetical protein
MTGGVQEMGLQELKSVGQFVITGFSTSEIATLNEQVAELPAASVTTNVFTVLPTGNINPLDKPAVCTIVAPGQLSANVTE